MNKIASYQDSTIKALGHAGFIVDFPDKKLKFAFDPFDIKEEELVDYVFI